MQQYMLIPPLVDTHRRVPLTKSLGALHISKHKCHLIGSIAQQLLHPSQLADARVVVLGPQEADGHNCQHCQEHWQDNLVPGSLP